MAPKAHPRRTYVVDPVFQYSLIRKISVIGVVIVVMSLSFLVIIHQLYGDIQIEVVQPDPFAVSQIVASLPVQTSLLKLIGPVLLMCVAAALFITFFYGIVISHRMAGPLFRIRSVLDRMAQGDLGRQIRLRKKDDFKNLAESVNGLISSWHLQLKELKELCQKLEKEDGKIQIENLNRLNEILATFKVEQNQNKRYIDGKNKY